MYNGGMEFLDKDDLPVKPNYRVLFRERMTSNSLATLVVDDYSNDEVDLEYLFKKLNEFVSAIAINILNEKSYDVYTKRFIEGKTLDEIGRGYGVTRERIRQLVEKSVAKLSVYFESDNNAYRFDVINEYYRLLNTITDIELYRLFSFFAATKNIHINFIKRIASEAKISLDYIPRFVFKPKSKLVKFQLSQEEKRDLVHRKKVPEDAGLNTFKRVKISEILDNFVLDFVSKNNGIYSKRELAYEVLERAPSNIPISFNSAINAVYQLLDKRLLVELNKVVYRKS